MAERHRLPARTKGLQWGTWADSVRIRINKDKVKAIFDKLLCNAIKYSPEVAPVQVRARHDGGRLVVDVTAEGPGIVAEERQRIFNPFVQGPPVVRNCASARHPLATMLRTPLSAACCGEAALAEARRELDSINERERSRSGR